MSNKAPDWFQEFYKNDWVPVKERLAADSVRMEQKAKDIEGNKEDIKSLKKTKYVAMGTGILATGEGIWLAIKAFIFGS
jgi:hypothetical protein